ncbi:hypothetical protein EDB86DRAFT_2838770 [Lactarius hatsudake]|nr:hypothetical protein EDB86DRAFT_2838770 [Lactarius hatsudake]
MAVFNESLLKQTEKHRITGNRELKFLLPTVLGTLSHVAAATHWLSHTPSSLAKVCVLSPFLSAPVKYPTSCIEASATNMKEMDIWYSLRSHFPLLDLSLPGYLPTSLRYSPTSPSFSPTSPRYFPQSHVVTAAALPPPSFATCEFSFTTTSLCESPTLTSCHRDAQDPPRYHPRHDMACRWLQVPTADDKDDASKMMVTTSTAPTTPTPTMSAGGSGSPTTNDKAMRHDDNDNDGRKDNASKTMATASTVLTTPTPTTTSQRHEARDYDGWSQM